MNAMRVVFALLATALIACDTRQPQPPPGGLARTGVRQIELQPGQVIPAVALQNPYEGNENAIAEGRRLYNWYNCSGCHFAGGGGIGPPLMDEEWIYGGEPQQILDSIMEGRADGMPSYRGKLPMDHAMLIVAYVRALSDPGESTAESLDRIHEDTQRRRVEEFVGEPLPEPAEQQQDDGGNGSNGISR